VPLDDGRGRSVLVFGEQQAGQERSVSGLLSSISAAFR
jgi:hypothetical protein